MRAKSGLGPSKPIAWRSSRPCFWYHSTSVLSPKVQHITTPVPFSVAPVANSIAMRVTRIDGGSGNALVSSGVPLRVQQASGRA